MKLGGKSTAFKLLTHMKQRRFQYFVAFARLAIFIGAAVVAIVQLLNWRAVNDTKPQPENVICVVSLCIVANGDETSNGYASLISYLRDHPNAAALILSSEPGLAGAPSVTLHNLHATVASRFIDDISGRLARAQSAISAANLLHNFAIRHVRACSIFELDLDVNVDKHGYLHDYVSNEKADFSIGVRPRGHLSPNPDTHSHDPLYTPVLNAYPLLSPARYYAPRGLPEQFISQDERGAGPTAPELIQVAVPEPSKIAIVQLSIDGVPDAEPSFLRKAQPIHHKPILKSIVLPAGIFHPLNRLATLHKHDSLWAMFLPMSVDAQDSDIMRGYITQAIFAFIGRHSALVAQNITRKRVVSMTAKSSNAGENTHVKTSMLMDDLLALLSSWSRRMQKRCFSEPAVPVCNDAGTLLTDVYSELRDAHFVSSDDFLAAKKWIHDLRKSGYVMPLVQKTSANIDISPLRPKTHNVHAAVHLNWGKTWQGVVPLWNAMHGAEFRQVTYHIHRRPDASNPSPMASIYPHNSFLMDERPGVTSGYVAHESAIQAWGVHDTSTDALLWTHEDAFVRGDFLNRWLYNTTYCVAAGAAGTLPIKQSEWSTFRWPWTRNPRAQLAAKHFIELIKQRLCEPYCFGRDITKAGLRFGYADIVGIRTTCSSKRQQTRAFQLVQAASDAGLFHEIGWPSTLRCAFSEDLIHEYRLYTRFDRFRNDNKTTWLNFIQNKHDAYHPIKFSPSVLTRLRMRDTAWATHHSSSAPHRFSLLQKDLS